MDRTDGPRGGAAVVGVALDVADSGAGDEAFALLDALWATAPVGLAYVDPDLHYRRVNGAVLDIDGGTVDDRLGRTLAEVHGATGAIFAEELADGSARHDAPALPAITGQRVADHLGCDHLVDGSSADTGDDIVVLAVRVPR